MRLDFINIMVTSTFDLKSKLNYFCGGIIIAKYKEHNKRANLELEYSRY